MYVYLSMVVHIYIYSVLEPILYVCISIDFQPSSFIWHRTDGRASHIKNFWKPWWKQQLLKPAHLVEGADTTFRPAGFCWQKRISLHPGRGVRSTWGAETRQNIQRDCTGCSLPSGVESFPCWQQTCVMEASSLSYVLWTLNGTWGEQGENLPWLFPGIIFWQGAI